MALLPAFMPSGKSKHTREHGRSSTGSIPSPSSFPLTSTWMHGLERRTAADRVKRFRLRE